MMRGKDMLDFLSTRRSVRTFADRAIKRDVLTRIVRAATTAPSSTNRQPWRFAVVTDAGVRKQLVDAVRKRSDEIRAIVARGHHAKEFGAYADFFWEPLGSAVAIVIPQYREYPDSLASFIESGGGDPTQTTTPAAMQMELCGTSAAVMTLLIQAHAEEVGACWMAGPTVARDRFHEILEIKSPWRMVGAVALGYARKPPPAPPRKDLGKVVSWFEAESGRK